MMIEKIQIGLTCRGNALDSPTSEKALHGILTSLLPTFDSVISSELYQQAAQSTPSPTLRDIAKVIGKAQEILVERLRDIQVQLRQKQREKQREKTSDAYKIERQIDQIAQQRMQTQEDLRMLTQPFGISLWQILHDSHRQSKDNFSQYDLPHSSHYNPPIDLKYMLYFSTAFGLIQLIIIYVRPDFLNLIMVTLLLLIYLLNHFDTLYLRITLVMLALSQVLDIIWLWMYMGQTWDPPAVGNHSSYQIGYIRFSLILIIINCFIKLAIGYFLFSYQNFPIDQRVDVDVGIMRILLTPGRVNPISKGVQNSIKRVNQ